MSQLPVSLMEMPVIFDKLNSVYRSYLESEIQNQVMPDKISLFIYSGKQNVLHTFLVYSLPITDGNAAAE